MLVENLIRLGRPFIDGGASPVELLRKVSDVGDVRARNFFQRVFVVEVAERDGVPVVVAHPHASWGHIEGQGSSERFQPDEDRVIGIPFVIPRGNPRAPQGRYPIPVYIVYDKDFASFANAPDAIRKFLQGRLSRTVGISYPKELIQQVSRVLSAEFARYERREGENCLAVIVIADMIGDDSPFVYDGDGEIITICESRVFPGRSIGVDAARLLDRVWMAKAAEGAEMGTRTGTCSICGAEGELVSIYSKAWSWFSVTWTAPLPGSLAADQLVEGIALCARCYGALSVGAQVFLGLAQVLPSWLTKEIFSPVDVPQAKENRKAQPDRIYGSLIALPVLDEFIQDEGEREFFVRSVTTMSVESENAVQRHLDSITGFEARLPLDFTDDRVYRLQLYYYSGDVGRGDVHLRAIIEDVLPSVASALDDVLHQRLSIYADAAAQDLGLILSPPDRERLRSLPYLLVTAYGAPYLWQSLADVLQRRSLGAERFIRNVAARMQAWARRLPDSYYRLCLEVLFYLVFREFLRIFHEEIATSTMQRRVLMRPWKELHEMLVKPVHEVQFQDVEELGFACGHLVRQFSRWYAKETGKDFLRHRVMTFGSDLTPELVWQRALSKFSEYRARIWRQGGLPRWFEELSGVVLIEFARRRDEIHRERASFMAAFWAGYALQSAVESDSEAGAGQKSAEAELGVGRDTYGDGN